MTIEEIKNKIEYRKQKLEYHLSKGNLAKAEWNKSEIAKFEAMIYEATDTKQVKVKPNVNTKVEPIKVEPVVFTDEEKIF